VPHSKQIPSLLGDNSLLLFREKIAVCSEYFTKHKYASAKVGFLSIAAVGTHSYCGALNG
jgi:hypothetical protein